MPTNNTQQDDEEGVADRLYAVCLESVETGRGGYVVSSLEVAFIVLRVVREIETNVDYDPDKPDNGDS